jgi:flavin reductase (DIM6/NTAB) family NADH-FMN oxidoreductase RutF
VKAVGPRSITAFKAVDVSRPPTSHHSDLQARGEQLPLIRECNASFECQLHEDALVDKYNFFIFEVVKAHVATSPKHPETLHYTGDGVFMVSGKIISRRSLFRPGML